MCVTDRGGRRAFRDERRTARRDSVASEQRLLPKNAQRSLVSSTLSRISRDRSISSFDRRISCLEFSLMSSLNVFPFGGVAGPSYDQEEPLRPKRKHSLSGPALQGRMFKYSDDVVDEENPQQQVGVLV